jgi:hypothetical protein
MQGRVKVMGIMEAEKVTRLKARTGRKEYSVTLVDA